MINTNDVITVTYLKWWLFLTVVLSFVHFLDSASFSFSQSSQGGGHRTLLYGHAILLKHTHSSMVSTFTIKCVLSSQSIMVSHGLTCMSSLFFTLQYLSCLTTSRSLTDKLAFDVGLQEDSTGGVALGCTLFPTYVSLDFWFLNLSIPGEACWWTIHPASKQRSEGEKVRVGDDLILVSVSSERYLVTWIWFTSS